MQLILSLVVLVDFLVWQAASLQITRVSSIQDVPLYAALAKKISVNILL
jgi:hypothetical protein